MLNQIAAAVENAILGGKEIRINVAIKGSNNGIDQRFVPTGYEFDGNCIVIYNGEPNYFIVNVINAVYHDEFDTFVIDDDNVIIAINF